MAEVYKRLGAISATGSITADNILYTCPAATSAVISTIIICNMSSSAALFTICVSPNIYHSTAGHIAYQASIAGNDTVGLTFGLTMDAVNKYLVCSASASTVSFSVFGSEIS